MKSGCKSQIQQDLHSDNYLKSSYLIEYTIELALLSLVPSAKQTTLEFIK